MNCCVNGMLELFKSGDTRCAAIAVAVAAFVLGLIVMCLVCKICCPCGKKSGKKADRPQKKGEEKPFEKRKPHPAPADGSVEIYVGNLSAAHHEPLQRQVQGLRVGPDARARRGREGGCGAQ